jgi:hypothetical protein
VLDWNYDFCECVRLRLTESMDVIKMAVLSEIFMHSVAKKSLYSYLTYHMTESRCTSSGFVCASLCATTFCVTCMEAFMA